MTRSEIIRHLVKRGHGADKALEIAIDFERGRAYAKNWLEALKIGK